MYKVMSKEIKKNEGLLKGKVVSTKMDKTVVVLVNRLVKHPKYGKYITKSKRYKAHDEGNVCQLGEEVLIKQTKPISKDKTFVVVK